MPLQIALVDESGTVLERVVDDAGTLVQLSRRDNAATSACLRFLDPLGDTIFNRLQAPVLLGELAGLRPALAPAQRPLLDRVIALAERVERGGHLYLKCMGD